MLPDRVSNPGPLTYKSGALPIALRGPALKADVFFKIAENESSNKLTASILWISTQFFLFQPNSYNVSKVDSSYITLF